MFDLICKFFVGGSRIGHGPYQISLVDHDFKPAF